jgi:hypothetical protein
MKFWLCTVVWREEIFVPIKPNLHLKRVRCVAHSSDIDFDVRKPVLLQYQTLKFGTNFTTDRKKDLGFTNHVGSILYFQINLTEKLVGSRTDMRSKFQRRAFTSGIYKQMFIHADFRVLYGLKFWY